MTVCIGARACARTDRKVILRRLSDKKRAIVSETNPGTVSKAIYKALGENF